MKKLLFIIMIFLPVTAWSANMTYMLDVQINTAEQTITGIARLKSDADIKLNLSVQNLKVLNLDGNDIADATGDILHLSLQSGKEIKIQYEALINKNRLNFIDKEHVFLTSGWYPQPDHPVEYALKVTLPKNFMAISESEHTTIQKQVSANTFVFEFNHPLDSLHLAASSRYVQKKDRYKNIDIEAYFFKEDAHLANAYLAHTKNYLAMYEKMLTPYPYRRFAIVENILPSGNSMPTFTLLGNQVVRLPFIVKTSLGHEILHQWFGNSVYIDFVSGNWAEGLTTYLSDHYYAALEGKDTAYRKQILVDYHAYVHADNDMPLSDFISRSNKAQSVIGYGKGAMLFHGLHQRFGDEAFYTALKDFIRQNRFRQASWLDIQHAFERQTREKLYTYFGDWLTRKNIPRLDVEDTRLYVAQGKVKLDFELLQQGEPYPLNIPITFYAGKHKRKQWVEVKKSKENVSLSLDELPNKIVLDENYAVMRHLAPEETPPVLAGIMGKGKLIAVISSMKRSTYQPLIDALGVKTIVYATPDNITFDQIQKNSLLIAGHDNPVAKMLFGKQTVVEDGLHIKVYKNPYNASERVAWLHAADKQQAQAVQYKLSHYGKYTELAFKDGRNTFKAIAESENGMLMLSRPKVRALEPDSLATIDDIIPRLTTSRIIYVGETHDQFAHHMNQLKVIKKIHEAGYQLAVGMEMFQKPYQQVVDDYLAGRIDEVAFLKKTEYFIRWRYDYNLYKPIIDYLKQQRIPLVALNVQGDLTRKIAREGMYDLSDKQKKELPSDMNFSNETYRKDLNQVFTVHNKQENLQDFNYFLQAQMVWDEGMAESAHRFLVNHPDHKMVILAGNGHVRYKYGIPDRLYRRNHEPFTVVVQDEEIEDGVADYVLLTTKLTGQASPKMGVMVEEKDKRLVIKGVIQNGPAQKAGLQKDDVIEMFEERPVQSLADLKIALFYCKIGSTVKIKVKRADKTIDKDMELFDFERFHQ
ncbi:MAG: ChaN family lipoprotein [Desulfobacterales bacterium]